MRREDAIMIDLEEKNLYSIRDVIDYLQKCYKNNENVCCEFNNELLYSCDGYTIDEYYILATGISFSDKRSLDFLIFPETRTIEDKSKLTDLLTPVHKYLTEMYSAFREELRNGKNSKKIN